MTLIDMTLKKLRVAAAALSVGALLALSACGGGGGGGTAMNTGGPSGPGEQPGAGGEPGTGGQPAVTPLAPAAGLAASAATPTPDYAGSASDTLATLLPNPSNSFAPLSSTLERNLLGESSISVTDDAHVKAISSDGANGFRVTYVIGTEEQTVHFEVGDYAAHPGESNSYYKEVAGRQYWLWAPLGSISGSEKNRGSTRYRYFDSMGTEVDLFDSMGTEVEDFAPSKRIYMSYGARTDGDRLPEGSATYGGDLRAEHYPMGDPFERTRISGEIRLIVEFTEGTLAGQVRNIWVRPPGRSWALAPATAHLDISDGRIVDGQWTAKWREVNPGDDDTFTGDALGEFYGPGAEEAGGVINGANSERVLAGYFGARKFELDPSVPPGTLAQPLSVAVHRNFVADSVEEARNTRVTSIESDGADGFRVTYVVDGERQIVHLEAGDTYSYPTGIGYSKQHAGARYRLYDDESGWLTGAPEFSHFNVSRWSVLKASGDRTRASIDYGFLTFGTATDAADMPSGSATYSGRAAANEWDGPDFGNDRSTFTGNLTLTADFDGGSIDGSITGIEYTHPGASRPEAIDASMVFNNGRISGSRFTADVTGSPLPPTVTRMAGTATGEFYGPAAAEVGGVIQGATAGVDPDGPFSTVWQGWFGGRKQ